MIFLGLDPGTSNNMAFAALLPEGSIRVTLAEPGDAEIRLRAVHAYYSLRDKIHRLGLPVGHPAVLALEWQRPLKDDPRPANISDLAAFAGIALATVQSVYTMQLDVLTPLPEEWKGQVLKHVKHNRIVAEAGLSRVIAALTLAGIPVPKNLGAFTKEFTGMAGNAIDAIGLALWARERSRLRDLIAKATMRGPQ